MSTQAQIQAGIISLWAGRVRFYYYFHKVNYAKALASLKADSANATRLAPKVLWAYYQLNLYQSVCRLNYVGRHWRGQFASIVSLAACGEFEKSAIVLKAFKLNKLYSRHQKVLAEALAPFSAALALDALQDSSVHPLLYASLLLKLDKCRQAEGMIQSWGTGDDALKPEIYLLKNYLRMLTPFQKLQNLNDFLACYDLAPMRLKQLDLPPAVTNIIAEDKAGNDHAATARPLVSVLMTAFNAAAYITSAVESILAQSYQNIELIIVDDASDDATLEVIKTLASRDQRIKYLRLPCNAGTYVAKTAGLQHAKGEFITCHDSDDWAHPSRIAKQLQPLLEDAQLIATISDWVRLQEDGLPFTRGVFPLMRLNPASPLFRKSAVLQKTGVWDLVRAGADSEFSARLKLVFGRNSVKRIRQPLTFGAHRPGSLMTSADTGYTQDHKNNSRLQYWEAWGQWHIHMLQRGMLPSLQIDIDVARPFQAPETLLVEQSVIASCLNRSSEYDLHQSQENS